MSNVQKITLGAFGTIVAISVSVGSVLYSAGYQGSRIDATEKRVDKIEPRLEKIERSLGRIEGALGIKQEP